MMEHLRRMNSMPVYHEMTKIGLVKWVDIEDYVEEYGLDMIFGDIGGLGASIPITTEQSEYAFTLLCERYAYSTMRYTDPVAGMLAMRRISRFAVPTFIQQQALYKEIYEQDINALRKQRQSIINTVEKPNDPVAGADTTPIDDLSSRQETTTLISTQIEEVMNKWRLSERNYIENFLNQYRSLFTVVIIDSDDVTLYSQED